MSKHQFISNVDLASCAKNCKKLKHLGEFKRKFLNHDNLAYKFIELFSSSAGLAAAAAVFIRTVAVTLTALLYCTVHFGGLSPFTKVRLGSNLIAVGTCIVAETRKVLVKQCRKIIEFN